VQISTLKSLESLCNAGGKKGHYRRVCGSKRKEQNNVVVEKVELESVFLGSVSVENP
jgi:hypothetical protein